MPAINFLDKAVVNTNAKEYAKIANKAAIRSKNLAMRFASEIGHRNVTAKDVIKACNDDICDEFYTAKGELTKLGKKELINSLKDMFKLKDDKSAKKITVRQFINKIVSDAESKTAKLDKLA